MNRDPLLRKRRIRLRRRPPPGLYDIEQIPNYRLSEHAPTTAAAAESGDEHGILDLVQLHDRPADPSVFGTDVDKRASLPDLVAVLVTRRFRRSRDIPEP